MIPMQLYMESEANQFKRYDLSLQSLRQSHSSEMKETQQSLVSVMKEAFKEHQEHLKETKEHHEEIKKEIKEHQKEMLLEYRRTESYKRDFEDRTIDSMRLSNTMNIRAALEMLTRMYKYDNPDLELKGGCQSVLNVIAEREPSFKETVGKELASRNLDPKHFESARSKLCYELSKYAHSCDVSNVIQIRGQDYQVQEERAACICYLRFLNRNRIVLQWEETESSKQVKDKVRLDSDFEDDGKESFEIKPINSVGNCDQDSMMSHTADNA